MQIESYIQVVVAKRLGIPLVNVQMGPLIINQEKNNDVLTGSINYQAGIGVETEQVGFVLVLTHLPEEKK